MIVYRIAKSILRAEDISGMGAFRNGGRWNSKGTYMLYASANSSLAFLENLVHFDETILPPDLYIISINIQVSDDLIYQLTDKDYPAGWLQLDNPANKQLGDNWMNKKKFVAIKVLSAVNPTEYNYLLNPLFPGYHDMVKILDVFPLPVDSRLIS